MNLAWNEYERLLTRQFATKTQSDFSEAETALMEIVQENYDLFAPPVFQMMLPDVIDLFVPEGVLYVSITNLAKSILRKDKLFPVDRNLPLPVAVFICWLEYCCYYKKYGRVYKMEGKERGYRTNKKALQEVVFSDCLNYGTGYKTGKAKEMEELYRQKLRIESIEETEDVFIPKEVYAFWSILHAAGFAYMGRMMES